MSYTIGELIKDPKPPVTVKKTDSVVHAVGLMRQHDYSQLPVVDGENRPIGIVTSDSILRSLDFLGSSLNGLLVSHAMQQSIPKLKLDDLLSVLQNRLLESYSALITNDENRLIGIVTNYDTAEYYRSRANDMMLVEEIENSLRNHVLASYKYDVATISKAAQRVVSKQKQLSPERLQIGLKKYFEILGQTAQIDQAALNRASAEDQRDAAQNIQVADLVLNDLILLLFGDATWQSYSMTFGGIDKTRLRSALNRVRDIRNVLAHFKRELTSADQHILNWCADFLSMHPPPQVLSVDSASEIVTPNDNRYQDSAGQMSSSADVETALEDNKYALLFRHFVGLDRKVAVVTLSFEEIERIVQSRLPSSARELRAWWANDLAGHSQAKYWLDADWRVIAVDRDEQTVTFSRMTERESEYKAFYIGLIAILSAKYSFSSIPNSSPGRRGVMISMIADESGKHGASFGYFFVSGGRFRAALMIKFEQKDLTEWVYLRLSEMKAEIGSDFGETPTEELSWEMQQDASFALIYSQVSGSINDNASAVVQLQEWAANAMVRLHKAFSGRIRTIIAHLPKG